MKKTLNSQLTFMHIPKTAGSSLFSVLKDSCIKRDPFASCFYASEERDLPEDCDFLQGHFNYPMVKEKYPKSFFMTVLREPLSRVLSLWLFWRTHLDEDLCLEQEYVKLSRKTLSCFLSEPSISGATDNEFVRRLLSPHPHVPEENFIDSEHDDLLVRAALANLKKFNFVDTIENKNFQHNLEKALGFNLEIPRVNETRPIPAAFKSNLRDELTPEAFALLRRRTRLDFQLWSQVVQQVLPTVDIMSFQQEILLKNIKKYARLFLS